VTAFKVVNAASWHRFYLSIWGQARGRSGPGLGQALVGQALEAEAARLCPRFHPDG